MVANLWFFYSLTASILWGVGYVLAEKILKQTVISPAFLMLTATAVTLPLYAALCVYLGEFKTGMAATFSSPLVFWLVVLHALTIIGGNFLILTSVVEKNATLVTMIEITYPLFVALFAYLILKEVQLTWATAAGAALIFSGVAVIYFKG